MRQCADSNNASLLNRIRIGSYNDEDIQCLESRLIPADSMHLFPIRQEVDNHNVLAQRSSSFTSSGFYAEHRFSENDIKPQEEFTDYYIPDDDRDAGGIPLQLQLSVGTHVMLIRNINTQYGLVNGALGFPSRERCS